jgi:hypothetical protein
MSNKFAVLKSISIEFNITSGHVALMLLGSYFSFRALRSYQDYSRARDIYAQHYSEIDKSDLQREHLKHFKIKISASGYPDDGNWVLSDFLTKNEWLALADKKNLYEERWQDCSTLVPLLIIQGMSFPWTATLLGTAYLVLDNRQKASEQKGLKSNLNWYKTNLVYVLILGSLASSANFAKKFRT